MDEVSDPGQVVSEGQPGPFVQLSPDGVFISPPTPPSRRRRGRVTLIVGAIVVIIGAALAVVASLGGSSEPWSGVAPADFVVSATQTTLGQHTADLVFGGSVTAAGHSVPITGSGGADFSSPRRFSATEDFAISGITLTEREILVGNNFYLGFSGGGQDISTLVPGKHWVQLPIPVGANSSVGTGTSDPLAQMQLLAGKGNTVSPLGTTTIRGATVSGYSVTISRQNLLNAEQTYISSSGLSAAAQQQLEQAARNFPTPTIKVWFDPSKLIRRMSFSGSQTQNGQTVTVNLVMDYVNFGAPVSITAPSPGGVATYNQFIAAAQAAGASVG